MSGAAKDVDILSPLIGSSEEACEYYAVAKSFADAELAPHAAKWDADSIFPEDALRAAAALGFGGLYVNTEHGGSGMSRADSMPIIEALAGADTSTTAYLTIHNMCAWYVLCRHKRRCVGGPWAKPCSRAWFYVSCNHILPFVCKFLHVECVCQFAPAG